MPIFPLKKSVTLDCPKCGKPTLYEKASIDDDRHFLLIFCTLGLWIPVYFASAIQDRMKPFQCADCGSTVSAKIGEQKLKAERRAKGMI